MLSNETLKHNIYKFLRYSSKFMSSMIIIKLFQQEFLESLKVLGGLTKLLRFGSKIDRILQNN
jgi:hypothetical protein